MNTNKKIINLESATNFETFKEPKRNRHNSWRDLFYWKAIKGILTAGVGGLIFLIIAYIAVFYIKLLLFMQKTM